jgi:hypothetical protein
MLDGVCLILLMIDSSGIMVGIIRLKFPYLLGFVR